MLAAVVTVCCILFSTAALAAAPDRPFNLLLDEAARNRAGQNVRYDGTYTRIPYPGGDVPANIGVCTDEIIRVYRAVGIDLQEEVHEDMKRNFSAYPANWGLSRPDSNIDHRRVPNLAPFFRRRGEVLSVDADPLSYAPGDLVTWELTNGLPHIGMVVSGRSAGGSRPLILHNIGEGPKIEDALLVGRITGRYRYNPSTTARQR